MMIEEIVPRAVELTPTNYIDLAIQALTQNPTHYATSPGGLVAIVLLVGAFVLQAYRRTKS